MCVITEIMSLILDTSRTLIWQIIKKDVAFIFLNKSKTACIINCPYKYISPDMTDDLNMMCCWSKDVVWSHLDLGIQYKLSNSRTCNRIIVYVQLYTYICLPAPLSCLSMFLMKVVLSSLPTITTPMTVPIRIRWKQENIPMVRLPNREKKLNPS